jgi:protein-S-isoprenylcysteine O-methyltransferase Ste14
MNLRLMKAIIVLPGTVLVFIPGAILLATRDSRFALELVTPAEIWFWLALLAAIIGLALSGWAAALFVKSGQGTPAPWDPPKRLVIQGPYRHVRNPMITGAFLMLLAESILFQSLPIATWMTVFFIGNAIYFPLIEEKGLEKKFGDEYRNYKANVPRWIPRTRPWKGKDERK